MMKIAIPVILMTLLLLSACGGGPSQADKIREQQVKKAPEPATLEEAEADWENSHGVGPIEAFELPATIDQELATTGQEIYESMCTACHKVEKRFIGPSPQGILDRRTPAWVMNMILNPEGMVQQDPIARQLLIAFNGSPMANQNLTKEQARAVLEYFRTL